MKFIKDKCNFIGFLSVTALMGVAVLIAVMLAKNTILQKTLSIDSDGSGGAADCSAGQYYNSSTDSCMNCPGAYTSVAGSTGVGSCFIRCSAGTRIANYRDTSCSACGLGYYKAASTHYYNDPAQSCTKCPDGYTTSTTTAGSSAECNVSTTQATSCSAGYYLSGGECYACSAGYYSAGGTATSCSPCTGNTISGAKAGSCTACGSDEIANSTHTTCSIHCAAGRYYNSSTDSCMDCPGAYTSAAGSTGVGSCYVYCAAGTRIANYNDGSCSVCGKGYYKSATTHYYNTAAESCTKCPDGYTTASTTAGTVSECSVTIEITSCPAGQGLSGGVCQTCAAGYYSAEGSTSCLSCAGNKEYSAAGAASCSTCASGKVANQSHTGCIDEVTSVQCQPGRYIKAGSTTCTSVCPAGSYCQGGNFTPSDTYDRGISPCPSGYTSGGAGAMGIQECKTTCLAGYYHPAGGDRGCVKCNAGTYSSSSVQIAYQGASTCSTCATGYIAASEGATTCTACPNGYTSNSDHTACVSTGTPTTYYTLTYDVNGGTAWTSTTCASPYTFTSSGAKCTKQVASGAAYGTLPTATRTGYTFKEWNTRSDGTGTKVTSSTTASGNVTIYAIWTANITNYTITYNVNGGKAWTSTTCASPYTFTSSGATCTKQVASGAAYGTLPTATRASYTFKEWNTKADETGTKVTSSTTASGNATVYAIWVINKYTLTYDVNGGTAWTSSTCASPYSFNPSVSTCTKQVSAGTAYGTLPTATRSNYTFKEWNTKADGTGTKVTSSTTASGNVTIYAIWVANTTYYTLTYDVNGGTAWTNSTCASPYTFTASGSTCTKRIVAGTAYGTLPTATRSNYTFKEWNTKAEGTGTKVTSNTTASGNATVYAIWVANTSVVNVTGIAVTPKNSEIEVGDSVILKATITPSNATVKTVTWTSSDNTIAVVDENGVVTGMSIGTVTITATTTDGNKSDTATVKVIQASGDCTAGTYIAPGTSICTPCVGNTYTNAVNQTSCTPCNEGQIANSTHTGCQSRTNETVTCSPGTYLKANGTTAEDCEICPPGYYCPGGDFVPLSEDQGKNLCPSNHIDGQSGTISQELCKIKCLSGTYKDTVQSDVCIPCPTGTTSNSHVVNYNQKSEDGVCYAGSNNPKTGLFEIGGAFIAVLGLGSAAYVILKKRKIENI